MPAGKGHRPRHLPHRRRSRYRTSVTADRDNRGSTRSTKITDLVKVSALTPRSRHV